ncbi:GntR family transcriptional regulator [Paracoccus sp. MBLB3053]|uniref:GntR family transcriptional regulator n=1 Tax=Paracoccus aurantius TaxID=3073814 RepID=A0ABU2HVB2_9RHOB|nr:GntR family transcriptional regulator [Paracoccus sp. MBLB3053]MDS9468993.1 GntR family transcriptional regulator [Paracoccus sp. MBLB3053]
MQDQSDHRRTDRVREALEEMIVEGRFADGERLDEVSLSKSFGVSRTPLREAFQALATSGLVEIRARRGTFVRFPSLEDVVEMFDVMAEIEALCGRHAARRMTAADRVAMEAGLVACEEAASRNEVEAYYHANHDFHSALYAASGNRFLAQEAERLHRRLKPFRRLQLRVRGRMQESLAEHRRIFEALLAGDETLVSAELRRHIAVQGDSFADLAASYRAAIGKGRAAHA